MKPPVSSGGQTRNPIFVYPFLFPPSLRLLPRSSFCHCIEAYSPDASCVTFLNLFALHELNNGCCSGWLHPASAVLVSVAKCESQ